MNIRRSGAVLAAFIALFLHFQPAVAAPATPRAVEAYAQPWIVNSNSFLMLVFDLPATEVKKFLPAGIEPHINEQGLVTTTFEMYETERISGIPGYKVAFIVVDVADHPSRTGIPGHFAIWGKVDSDEALAFFTREFGFPYQRTTQIKVQVDEKSQFLGAIAGEQGELVRVVVAPIQENAFIGGGMVNMVGIRPGVGLVKSEVPFLTDGHMGKVISLQINHHGDPVLALLKTRQPAWALVSNNQIFAYSHVIAVPRDREISLRPRGGVCREWGSMP